MSCQSEPDTEGKGWYSRGYLPHYDRPGLFQSITFRLHDSVPQAVVMAWRTELNWVVGLPATDRREVDLRRRIDRYEDAGHGACWLAKPSIASLAERPYSTSMANVIECSRGA